MFFNDTATTEIYTLALHDALPICITEELEKCPPGQAQNLTQAVVWIEKYLNKLGVARSMDALPNPRKMHTIVLHYISPLLTERSLGFKDYNLQETYQLQESPSFPGVENYAREMLSTMKQNIRKHRMEEQVTHMMRGAAPAAAAAAEEYAAAGAKGGGKGKGKGKDNPGKGGGHGPPPPSAGSPPKGKEKPKGKGKDQTRMCLHYQSEDGCSRGAGCKFEHPPTKGKCFRCGSVHHSVKDCNRPAPKGKGALAAEAAAAAAFEEACAAADAAGAKGGKKGAGGGKGKGKEKGKKKRRKGKGKGARSADRKSVV